MLPVRRSEAGGAPLVTVVTFNTQHYYHMHKHVTAAHIIACRDAPLTHNGHKSPQAGRTFHPAVVYKSTNRDQAPTPLRTALSRAKCM